MVAPKITQPALYRVTQFFAALKASLPAVMGGTGSALSASDEALIRTILMTPAQYHLFTRMPPNDRRHAMAVVRTLQQAGYHHPALLQAALLHDVGKSLSQPIIYRVAIVLLEAFWPAGLDRLSAHWTRQPMGEQHSTSGFDLADLKQVGRWRLPFVVHAHHPAIGAIWAEEADCEPLAISLIARHQETLPEKAAGEETSLLAALQWADDLN